MTGPNMGGKSSTVRMVALLCIMGQVRSQSYTSVSTGINNIDRSTGKRSFEKRVSVG